jgi:hypothetical protein
MRSKSKPKSAEVRRCLDAVGGDVIRALELACATTIILGRNSSLGLNRGQPRVVDVDAVPELETAQRTGRSKVIAMESNRDDRPSPARDVSGGFVSRCAFSAAFRSGDRGGGARRNPDPAAAHMEIIRISIASIVGATPLGGCVGQTYHRGPIRPIVSAPPPSPP